MVATSAVHRDLSFGEIIKLLSRHFQGDWGDLDEVDRKLNDEVIAHEGNLELQSRVLSKYAVSNNENVYITTEADRSVTTILYKNEY